MKGVGGGEADRPGRSTKYAVNIFEGDENERLFRDAITNSKVKNNETPFWLPGMSTDNVLH